MPQLSLWNQTKKNDYKFFDRTISEMFRRGGTAILVHKYIGTYNQNLDDKTQPDYADDMEVNIQDLLFLENRDRKYDQNVYELRGSYTVNDNDFDLSQFASFLSSDSLYMSFHLNDMIDIMGRKLMSGDVLEVVHLKDDTLLSKDKDNDFGEVIPKFYKVDDGNRSAQGFSPTWYPHIWRVKISPITDSQEFRDIIGDAETEGDLANILSTYETEKGISDAIVEQATIEVPYRNPSNQHLYVLPNHPETGLPYVYMTDGIPPNGAEISGSGDDFPINPADGTWFMRTDYVPNVLYKRNGPRWERIEVDWTQAWQPANRTLTNFINNRRKMQTSQGLVDSKVAISKAITSKIKPDSAT